MIYFLNIYYNITLNLLSYLLAITYMIMIISSVAVEDLVIVFTTIILIFGLFSSGHQYYSYGSAYRFLVVLYLQLTSHLSFLQDH